MYVLFIDSSAGANVRLQQRCKRQHLCRLSHTRHTHIRTLNAERHTSPCTHNHTHACTHACIHAHAHTRARSTPCVRTYSTCIRTYRLGLRGAMGIPWGSLGRHRSSAGANVRLQQRCKRQHLCRLSHTRHTHVRTLFVERPTLMHAYDDTCTCAHTHTHTVCHGARRGAMGSPRGAKGRHGDSMGVLGAS